MSGIQIVGQNETTTNSASKIANSNNIAYNGYEGENKVRKAMFGVFVCLCMFLFVIIIMMWVRNKWRKGKYQVGYILTSIRAGGSVRV